MFCGAACRSRAWKARTGYRDARSVRNANRGRSHTSRQHYRVGLDCDDSTLWIGEAIALDAAEAKRLVAGRALDTITLSSFCAVPVSRIR